ncbi:hypothetical protein DRP77_02930 [Candidatus Poribacteria bacterium]|nr:MAG: hypothetical protein DRP77_02930 [Candidatus Poribacteria bacterium]
MIALLLIASLAPEIYPPNPTVGDPITLSFEVETPSDWLFLPPERLPGGLKLLSAERTERGWRIVLEIRLFSPGVHIVRPPSLTFLSPEGVREIPAAPARVEVRSVSDGRMRWIKTADRKGERGRIIGLSLLIGGISTTALIAYRSSKKINPPEERAIEEIERVERMGLILKGETRKHCSLILDRVKLYLEETFGTPVRAMSTEEIGGLIDDPELISLLREGDAVKFGGRIPSKREAQLFAERAKRIVRRLSVCQKDKERDR